jgi:SAM-dependent methyltransferase
VTVFPLHGGAVHALTMPNADPAHDAVALGGDVSHSNAAGAAGAGFDYDAAWDQWEDMKRYGPMSRHTRRLVHRLIAPLHFASALDVGCGEGSLLQELAARSPGIALAGVDVSAQALALARRRLPQATFCALDLTRAPLRRTFDLVICTDVLEHIEDDRAALRNMRAMTGRWLVVGTLQGRMRRFERHVGHVRNYGRGELRAKLEEAGFVVRRQVDWGFPLYSPLYRDVLERTPPAATMGRFGRRQRLLASLLYYAFCLNAWRWGDYVFCVAEIPSEARRYDAAGQTWASGAMRSAAH